MSFTFRTITRYYAPMSQAKVEEFPGGIRVETGAWTFEHQAAQGGACCAIVSVHGANGNLLRGPISAAIRTLASDGSTRCYRESFDREARVRHETAGGVTAVVAEGVFRDESGQTVPVGFRRRTEYHDHGLIWTTLEVMSDCGCPDVIEMNAASILVRRGMAQCSIKLHPTQAGGADLLGAAAELPLAPETTAFLSRFTPLNIQCLDRAGSDGIEVFPASDLASWDYACKSDLGLGFYRIDAVADGVQLDWMPYCLAQRRLTTVLQGKITLRLGFALPTAAQPRLSAPEVGWNADDESFRALAAAGTRVVCFRENMDANGRGWPAGVYPPCDADGIERLRRLIERAHANGLKIVAPVSAHELHPNAAEFARHGNEWMHMAAPSLGTIGSWNGNVQTGALMCLNSGWLEYLKRHIDTVLNSLPWDGVCLFHASAYPCCHPAHGRAYHSDLDGWMQLLAFCRARAGSSGVVLTDSAAARSIAAGNFTDGHSIEH